MNTMLLTNSFQLPPDDWYQIAPKGEFPHNPTGLVQVIDAPSIEAIVSRFNAEASQPNFPGILIDFDHFSLDHDKPSEAAGWIVALEPRPDGLWAKIRWSDTGQQAVTGGRYRFISPVFRQDECTVMENQRVRPMHLVNAAVTNDPNISGMVPLSNRDAPPVASPPPAAVHSPTAPTPRRDLAPFLMLIRGAMQPHCSPRRILANASRILDDDQRKAMFARLSGGHWGGGGGGTSHSTSNLKTPRTSPISADGRTYTPTRDYAARISDLEAERDRIATREPTPPELTSYKLTDTRKLESDLFKEGVPFAQIHKQVAAAEAENKRVRGELSKMKKIIRAKHKDPAKRKAYLQIELDKAEARNQKNLERYDKERREWEDTAAELDGKIAAEKIGQREDIAAAKQAAANAEARARTLEERKAARELAASVAAEQRKVEKAERDRARAEAQAAKDADPVLQYKRRIAKNSLYWKAIRNNDLGNAQSMRPDADVEADAKRLSEGNPDKNLARLKHTDPTKSGLWHGPARA